MALTVKIHEADGISILVLDGRMVFEEDMGSLRKSVKTLIARGETRIALNLEHVLKIDSVGLGVLVAVHNTASTRGVSLRLCNLAPQIKLVLQITKLLSVFEVTESEAEAVRALRGFGAGA